MTPIPWIRVRKDGSAVAIRRHGMVPDDHALAWAVMTVENGGHLSPAEEVLDDELWEDR